MIAMGKGERARPTNPPVGTPVNTAVITRGSLGLKHKERDKREICRGKEMERRRENTRVSNRERDAVKAPQIHLRVPHHFEVVKTLEGSVAFLLNIGRPVSVPDRFRHSQVCEGPFEGPARGIRCQARTGHHLQGC